MAGFGLSKISGFLQFFTEPKKKKSSWEREIWEYWFNFPEVTLSPSHSLSTGVTVSKRAALKAELGAWGLDV